MKSDKEFIDGIYEKASNREKSGTAPRRKTKGKSTGRLIGFAAAVFVLFLIPGTILERGDVGTDNTQERINPIQMENGRSIERSAREREDQTGQQQVLLGSLFAYEFGEDYDSILIYTEEEEMIELYVKKEQFTEFSHGENRGSVYRCYYHIENENMWLDYYEKI